MSNTKELLAENRQKSRQKRSGNPNPKTAQIAGFQFKPGVSGNPGGRPKSKRMTAAYIRYLEQEDPNGETGADLIAQAICDRAKSGDVRAASLIADRTEGKPPQAIKIEDERRTTSVERVEEILRHVGARQAAGRVQ